MMINIPIYTVYQVNIFPNKTNKCIFQFNKQYIHKWVSILPQQRESVAGRVEKVKCIRQTSYKGFGKSTYILSVKVNKKTSFEENTCTNEQ